MAFKNLEASLKEGGNSFHAIKTAIQASSFSAVQGAESFSAFQSGLGNIAGQESMELQKIVQGITHNQFDAFHGALSRQSIPSAEMDYFREVGKTLAEVAGYEGFSLQNEPGKEQDIKAANLTLNAQSHMQTKAAEALFSTITVKYEDEGANLKVRAAGLGHYAYGNSAWQSASELRPIFGLLKSGDMFKDEVLALYPVYPESGSHENRLLFAPESLVAPTEVNYPDSDAYGRDAHRTQYLKVPVTIPNLLALTQAPGQRAWTNTDEIESNSISLASIGITGKLGNTATSFFINTKAMSNNTFGPTTTAQSSDDRGLSLYLRLHTGFSVLDKDGKEVGETIFKDFKDAGFEPLLNVSFNGNYQRQGNELRLLGGTAEIAALREIATGTDITIGRATDAQKQLIRTFTDGTVAAAKFTFNVSNTSRGNFGYRIEVFDAFKRLSVRRNSPISVKYPISADDNNQSALDFAIQQMSVVINNQCSKKAFEVAQDHLRYITSIDGAPVVGNNQGSNVLAGQHFVTASAVNRTMKLRDVVSSVDSQGVFDNVTASLLNEISDITAALNTKSGLAAISEYGGAAAPEWTVVIHQNLTRFIMRSGDARSIGPNQTLDVQETNFDSQIGQLLIVPKNTSTSEFINPLGGIGVNISKENIVVQGNVTRDQQDFGVVMTLPTYKHWPLCPIIGSLTIEDAHEFLGDAGLLTQLAKQRVTVEGLDARMGELIEATKGEDPVPNP